MSTKLGVGESFGNAKSGQLEMVVTRADGTVEDYGTVAHFHKNPIKNWWLNRKSRKEQIRRIKYYDD
jgi:hypothetical protein